MTASPSGAGSVDLDVDLLAAARDLKRRPQFRKLAGLIEKLFARHSCRVDLDEAKRRVLLINAFPDRGDLAEPIEQDQSEAAMISSFFISGLILYCRATDTKSDHRQRVPISDRFNENDRAIHRNLIDLRNQVIAHFGPGLHLQDGYWAQDRMWLEIRDNRGAVFHGYERANYRSHLVVDLDRLIDQASVILINLLTGAEHEVHAEIERVASDPNFLQIFARHRVPIGFHRRGVDGVARTTLSPPQPRST